MKFAASIVALSCLPLCWASAVVAPDHTPLKHRTVRQASWEVEVSPGGPTVVLHGTVEEVYAQLIKLNPDRDAQFADYDSRMGNHTTLEKRTDFSNAKLYCGWPWPTCDTNTIQGSINHLRHVRGRPWGDCGPGNCMLASCQDTFAIWWCNDDPKPKTLLSYGSIADGAQYLLHHCVGIGQDSFSGQIFHHTNWNVIVSNSTC
ncbi:Uncharacterized protein TCAP_03816 [Tolypocladium capitatum]|uniref:Secreted protein n=1 Tax=Tolypocladium capitatum TaxID=45235 RepID=A0A2K3QFG3_9HYPO|nr:Uncharacterized protein TCAP_03816 [Tolypocladium capitatum]